MGGDKLLLQLSESRLNKLKKRIIEKQSQSSVTQFIKIFRAIILEEADEKKKEGLEVNIKESELYEQVMVFGLKEVANCLNKWTREDRDGVMAVSKQT